MCVYIYRYMTQEADRLESLQSILIKTKVWRHDMTKENGICSRGNKLWEDDQEIYGGNQWKMSMILVGLFEQIEFSISSW